MKDLTIVCFPRLRQTDEDHYIEEFTSLVNFFDPYKTIVFTDATQGRLFKKVKHHSIAAVGDYAKCNTPSFVLTTLVNFIRTPHVLLVYSAFKIKPDKWNDEFLKYHYIAPPLAHFPENNNPPFPPVDATNSVGYGGFSLRSRSLMLRVSQLFCDLKVADNLESKYYTSEYEFICRLMRHVLEKEGFLFPTEEFARTFGGGAGHNSFVEVEGFNF